MAETTHDASLTDDGFHEIQLSGKQLVFLFMMATVVLVATFLLGVQVGRSVRGEHGLDVATAEALSAAVAPPSASTPSQPAASASAGPPSAEPPSPAQEPDDELSYAKRLQGDNAPAEKLKTPSASNDSPGKNEKNEKHDSAPPKATGAPAKAASAPAKTPSAPAKAATASPTPAVAPPTPATASAAPSAAPPKPWAQPAQSPSTPAASGRPGAWVVQLQALKNRGEATDIAGRLAAKGFPAFVLDPVPGEPVYYRVQVGGYADRPQADQVARQLEKDEHYKPYVHRR